MKINKKMNKDGKKRKKGKRNKGKTWRNKGKIIINIKNCDDKSKGWRAILQFVRERNYSCH